MSFGVANKLNERSRPAAPMEQDSACPAADDNESRPKIVYPAGTKIEVTQGRYDSRAGEIHGYAAVGWYSVVFTGSSDICKVRSTEFRCV